MKNLTLISLILVAFVANIVAQEKILTETENDLYWHPERKIEFSDYQDPSDANCIRFNELFGMQTSANMGFRGIVDVPENWNRRRNRSKLDKGYIVPVFCKNCSCILSKDSLGLKVDRLLFDVGELCARNVRRELSELQKDMNIRNVNSMFFTTVKNSWDERRKIFVGQILRDVFVYEKENAYEYWRQTIDELLDSTIEFATTDNDRLRFVLGKPIKEGYKQAERIMGDMRRDREQRNE